MQLHAIRALELGRLREISSGIENRNQGGRVTWGDFTCLRILLDGEVVRYLGCVRPKQGQLKNSTYGACTNCPLCFLFDRFHESGRSRRFFNSFCRIVASKHALHGQLHHQWFL